VGPNHTIEEKSDPNLTIMINPDPDLSFENNHPDHT